MENSELIYQANLEIPSKLCFDISTRDTEVEGRYYLEREIEGSKMPIAIVGRQLTNQTPHEPYFRQIIQNLHENIRPGDLEQAVVEWHTGLNDCFVVMDVRFPTIGYQINNDSYRGFWEKSLRLIVLRSLDGSYSNIAMYGDIDWFCMNLSIKGDFQKIKQKNTKAFNIMEYANRINDVSDMFHQQMHRDMDWANIVVTDTEAYGLFESLFPPKDTERSPNSVEKLSFADTKKSRSKVSKVWKMYEEESAERGSNLYTVMSALTRESTHAPVRKTVQSWKTENITRHKREIETQKILESDKWKDFVDSVTIH